MSGTTSVVVVGGGYAGVMAANRLTRRKDLRVTVVNPRRDFVERIRLHQLVTGSHPAVADYARVLAPAVELVVATATRIDRPGRRVELAERDAVGYDHLVYAVGSGSAALRVPGAREHAHPLADHDAALRLRAALAADPSAPVTVVGAGPTGLEVAAELAEAGRASGTWRPVTLFGGVLGPYLHPSARASAVRRLASLGVRVLDGRGSVVTRVRREAVELADGREVPSGVVVWTAGFGVPDLARRSGLSTDPEGRLLTDETLTSVDDDRVVGAGDSAAPSGRPFRMSCQAAVPLGAQAADTVLHHVDGRAATPVRIGFVGQCVSLGRADGIVQLAHRDDTARRTHLAGRPAATIKELVCRGTVQQLTWEARWPGTSFVPGFLVDRSRPADR